MDDLRILCIILLTGLNTAAGGKEKEINSKERFAMKYVEAASSLTPKERLNYASEDTTYDTVVDIGRYARVPFVCREEVTPGDGAISVHELQPADIDVVAAIGDSITAASGVDSIFIIGSLTQYRGSSWSVGGDGSIGGEGDDDPIVTIPNIIKYFKDMAGAKNDLNGWSEGTGNEARVNARLNQAVIGSTAEDLLEQAQIVVNRMKATNSSVSDTAMDFDFETSWKLMTILIGGNDMCEFCNDRERYSAEKYVENIKMVLDLLLSVPRMLVNIVPMFTITPLKQVSKGRGCDIFHNLICPCVMDDSLKEEMDQLAADYYQGLKDLVYGGGNCNYDRDDFAVVLQDSLVDFAPIRDPETQAIDLSIFAPDCFHPNRKGHELLAYILWNTMIKWPVGMKPTRYPIYSERGNCPLGFCQNNYYYACPTAEYPYLWTCLNSKDAPESDFNYTTTTTTLRPTTSTTTVQTSIEREVQGNETAWITIGCIIGAMGILALVVIAYLFVRERNDDEKSFFA